MSEFADDLGVVLAQKRYERIAEIVDLAVKKDAESVLTYTDMLDRVFLNKYLGIPIFLTFLWVMFQFSFTISEPFVVLIEKFFESLNILIEQNISDPYLLSFLSSGVIGGLGSVLVFVPPIFALFLALSILEDTVTWPERHS
jgi:ferrous iron transport protein B